MDSFLPGRKIVLGAKLPGYTRTMYDVMLAVYRGQGEVKFRVRFGMTGDHGGSHHCSTFFRTILKTKISFI